MRSIVDEASKNKNKIPKKRVIQTALESVEHIVKHLLVQCKLSWNLIPNNKTLNLH